ncbi:hypothetical protein Poly59_57660 [Rubripirellula reticaptiva]|uniref:Uncharacterized protein n=1 Tax=Rubripirellula reticaptiva TaxID=2528013 RepID=A0A5C6EAP3_9BACT|nr:hypothetical protein Poly59_57660 [Rubripirellula reticaptiva]
MNHKLTAIAKDQLLYVLLSLRSREFFLYNQLTKIWETPGKQRHQMHWQEVSEPSVSRSCE